MMAPAAALGKRGEVQGVLLHADDLGLSRGITRAILECCDQGPLTGVSLVATGPDFDFAVAELARRPELRVSVHLNLSEGSSLCPAADVSLLVDDAGRFRHSFAGLWAEYLFGSKAKCAELRRQVAAEFAAQCRRIQEALPGRVNAVDSHQHYHMIPFVFAIAAATAQELGIGAIRVADEPFFLAPRAPQAGRAYLGANLAKHLLLRVLSGAARRRVRACGLESTDAFVGALFSGCMGAEAVRAALAALGPGRSVEVLFHPGGAADSEAGLWDEGPHRRFYFSADRRAEARELSGPALAAAVAAYGSGVRRAT